MGVKYNPFDRGYFPEPSHPVEEGLLAAGGTLSVEVLLEAYSKGIFPWYSEGSPVLWWSPDPRMVLFPERFKVSRSLSQTLRKGGFMVRMDTAFGDVIEQCARQTRPGQKGTWITGEMIQAYLGLHREGFAHSVEVFREDLLVGGLYGVSLGRTFFGESMFHLERDASKVALYHLVEFTKANGFDMIDTQQSTRHLRSLGAEEISREEFLGLLGKSLDHETLRGKWVRNNSPF